MIILFTKLYKVIYDITPPAYKIVDQLNPEFEI